MASKDSLEYKGQLDACPLHLRGLLIPLSIGSQVPSGLLISPNCSCFKDRDINFKYVHKDQQAYQELKVWQVA